MSGADLSHSEYVGGLFRLHYPWLCARLRSYSDACLNAEDVAAESFVQLLEAKGLPAIREPRALLTTIAQRLIYRAWRRRDLEREHLEQVQHDEPFSRVSPEDLTQLSRTLEGLDQALDRLPDKVKATFLLSRLDGLTYPQIATRLGISQRSVSVYMDRSQAQCAPWNGLPSANQPLLKPTPFQRSA